MAPKRNRNQFATNSLHSATNLAQRGEDYRTYSLFGDLTDIQLQSLVRGISRYLPDKVLSYRRSDTSVVADSDMYPRTGLSKIADVEGAGIPAMVLGKDASFGAPPAFGILAIMATMPIDFITTVFAWYQGREKIRNDLVMMRRKCCRLVLAGAWIMALQQSAQGAFISPARASELYSDLAIIGEILLDIRERCQTLCTRKRFIRYGFKFSGFRLREETAVIRELCDRIEAILGHCTGAYDINWARLPCALPEDTVAFLAGEGTGEVLNLRSNVALGMALPSLNGIRTSGAVAPNQHFYNATSAPASVGGVLGRMFSGKHAAEPVPQQHVSMA